MRRMLVEAAGFLFGYLVLKLVFGAPDWGAALGGWMVMMWTTIELKK